MSDDTSRSHHWNRGNTCVRCGLVADASTTIGPCPSPSAAITPTTVSSSRVTVADYNAAFDPADGAFGGAFKDGFREGWLFGKDPAFEDREDLESDYQHVVDMAPTECWDAYREKYFALLPLAALPLINDTTVEDLPVSIVSGIDDAFHSAFQLEWIAGARPPVHPSPMTGRHTFPTFGEAVAFMNDQAADAQFVKLVEFRMISHDRSMEAREALSATATEGE